MQNDNHSAADNIVIPVCSYSYHNGFWISGVKKQLRCKHPHQSFFALVYRLLIRSDHIQIPFDDIFQTELTPEEKEQIYVCAVMILMLIRHNLYTDTSTVSFTADISAVNIHRSLSLILYYDTLFSAIANAKPNPLKYKPTSGIRIALHTSAEADISITSSDSANNEREIWYGSPVRYQIHEKQRPLLTELLRTISPYSSFLEGQYEALCMLMNTDRHSICVMPTGSGKSLLFYMASFLQPLPMFVIAPNAMLIQDQIRNLHQIHKIDDAAALEWTAEQNFSDFQIRHYINYLTPETLQCRNLFTKMLHFDQGTFMSGALELRLSDSPLLSYIVLDEVHSLSKWGHEFYPEYLMLAQHLQHFVSHIPLLGFTATANYAIASDLQQQLHIEPESMISTVRFERYQVSYAFSECSSNESLFQDAAAQITELYERHLRTIVFVKNDTAAVQIAKMLAIPYAMLVGSNEDHYLDFVSGNCDVLIAGHTLGIGINLPNIRCTVHIGLPFSKNDFVQEIGRAGRAGESVFSYVYYLCAEGHAPDSLTDRNCHSESRPAAQNRQNTDYDDILAFLYPFSSQTELAEKLEAGAKSLTEQNRALLVQRIDLKSAAETKQLYYMLSSMGLIEDWYLYHTGRGGAGFTEIMVDLFSSSPNAFSDASFLLRRIRQRFPEYLTECDAEETVVRQAASVKTLRDALQLYAGWYFQQYLYQHKESFLDLYDFIVRNQNSLNEEITAQIQDYYTLPFLKIRSDAETFLSLDPPEILHKIRTGTGRATVNRLENRLTLQYDPKLDYAVLLGKMRFGSFEATRANRVFSKIQCKTGQIQEILTGLYGFLFPESRIKLLNWTEQHTNIVRWTMNELLKNVYAEIPKDQIYYGFAAQRLNRIFERG